MSELDQTMLAPSRRARILEALAADGEVRISQLTVDLGVSTITLRRDLALLEAEGRLARVHGGAISTGQTAAADETATSDDTRLAGQIGVLLPSLESYWPDVIEAIKRRIAALGGATVVRSASYELQDERPLLQRLTAMPDIRGLIVAPNSDSAHAQEVIDFLSDGDLPSVLIEREGWAGYDRAPVESVVTDHAFGAALAARHLARLGHHRVGLLIASDSPTSRKILIGWQTACADLDVTPTDHFETEFPPINDPAFAPQLRSLLNRARTDGVTGLLVHSDLQAMALADLAMSQGVTIPDELSVIAYDDVIAENFSPALTAIRPPRAALGATAVELLAHRINDPGRVARRVLLTPELTVRGSTAAHR